MKNEKAKFKDYIKAQPKYMLGSTNEECKKGSPNYPDCLKQKTDPYIEVTGNKFNDDVLNIIGVEKYVPNFGSAPNKLDMGRYKDLGFYNVETNGDNYRVLPTSKNPYNAEEYKNQMNYFKELNPDAQFERDGFRSMTDRKQIEYKEGGEYTKYALGSSTDCQPGSLSYPNCLYTDNVLTQGQLTGEQPQTQEIFRGNTVQLPVDANGIPTKLSDIRVQNNQSVASPISQEDEDLYRTEQEAIGNMQMINSKEFVDFNKANEADPNLIDREINRLTAPPKVEENYQMPNIYGSVDIPSAANFLGQSIRNKDATGIALSGIKLATGLGRGVVGGLGQSNRQQQIEEEFRRKQKDAYTNPIYAKEGTEVTDQMLLTGEYITGQDPENPYSDEVNGEVEAGEYYKTAQGEVSEVMGKKHSQGGEKLKMEQGDKVLTDHLKIGKDLAKEIKENFDIDVKAKNTYSDVLDKYRSKSGLKKLIEEEEIVIKKLAEQKDVQDRDTREMNEAFLEKKLSETAQAKEPLLMGRTEIYDYLFQKQQDSKPKEVEQTMVAKDGMEVNEFETGGMLEMASQYGISPERARELYTKFKSGGEVLPKYEDGVKIGDTDPITGKVVTKEIAAAKVKSGEWKYIGGAYYLDEGTKGKGNTGTSYREAWESGNVDKNKYPTFEEFEKAAKAYNSKSTPDQLYRTEEETTTLPLLKSEPGDAALTAELMPNSYYQTQEVNAPEIDIEDPEMLRKQKEASLYGNPYLLPDQSPLLPEALAAEFKAERTLQRLNYNDLDFEPVLQDIRLQGQVDQESNQGLSPNVAAANSANMRAQRRKALGDQRLQYENINTQNRQQVDNQNTQLANNQENIDMADNLNYTQRQLLAKANTRRDIENYYNTLQANNRQNFNDVNDRNLTNALYDDFKILPDGTVTKTGDDELSEMEQYIKLKNKYGKSSNGVAQ